MKKRKISLYDTLPGVTVEPTTAENKNMNMPITAKVKSSAKGTKLKK